MATGSYEGPLLMEGILDHHEASAVTGGRSGWSWRDLAPSDPLHTLQKREEWLPRSTHEGV
jgi:hypothetical protein